MFNKLLQSLAFAATLTLGTLFSHNFQPVGRMSIWAEACVRFIVAAGVNFVVLEMFKRKKGNRA